jgi:hypothetical protein
VRDIMRSRLAVAAAVAAVWCVQATSAQRGRSVLEPPAFAGDAQVKATLDAVGAALGMIRGSSRQDTLWSIEYWGEGMTYAFGQSYKADGPWPGFKTQYHATLTYNAQGEPGMRVELSRTNPDAPIQGGGGLPLVAPQQQIQVAAPASSPAMGPRRRP